MNVSEISQLITDNILNGGRRTTAERARTVFNAINTSFLNIEDHLNVNGGYLGIDSSGKVDVSKIKKDTPTGQYLRDDGTWSSGVGLNGNGLVRVAGTAISYDNSAYITLASALTGYLLPGSNSAITASDNVLTAFGKAQFQINYLNSAKYQGGVSANYYPLSNGTNTLVDGKIYHQFGALFMESADANAYMRLENNHVYFNANGGVLELHDDYVQLVGTEGHIGISDGSTFMHHNVLLEIDAPAFKVSQLTASRVLYLDSDKIMRSSLTGPTALNHISTLSSNAQDQFDALYSLVVGSMNLRGAYTPSGGNYPSSGGSGSAGAIKKGNYWIASGIGGSGQTTIGSQTINNKDSIVALVDSPGQTDSNWSIVEGNIGYVPLNQSLAAGFFYLGSASNIGTAVQMSGDATMSDTGVLSIGSGKITDAMIVSSFIKADGTVPLSGDWDAGYFRIKSGGLDVESEGDGINVTANLRGIVINSDEIALEIESGKFKFNDPNKADGNVLVIDANGYVTSTAFTSDAFIKIDGTTPLSGNWNAGPFTITAGPVTIGDEQIGFIVNGAIIGGEINSLGDALRLTANQRGVVINSNSIALDIESGGFKFNDSGKRLGNIATSDDEGNITLQTPSSYAMPSVEMANTSANNTDANIFICPMPKDTFVNDGDITVHDFVIANTGGLAADVMYKVKMNSTTLNNSKMVPLNTSSDPTTLRVTIERLTSSSFRYTLQYHFSTHTTSLRTIEFNTITGFDFTVDSTLYIVANQLESSRGMGGVFGVGRYYKFNEYN